MTTPKLKLKEISASQSQKEVTANETFRMIDQFVNGTVLSRTTTTPAVAPVDGDAYIIPASATGSWAGKTGQIAYWLSNAWAYLEPLSTDRWTVRVIATETVVYWTGTAWADLLSGVYQPLDATLTALAGQNWAANAMPLGTGADTVSQLALAANTFPARASTGNVVAKPITDNGLAFLAAASIGAMATVIGLGTGDSPTFTGLTTTGSVIVGGDLTVNGTTTTLNVSQIAVEDPLIKLANGNAVDTLDLGFYAQYQPAATPLYAGLFRDATDDKFKLYRALEVEPTTTVNTAGTGYTVGTLVASLESTSATITGGAITGTTFNSGVIGGTTPAAITGTDVTVSSGILTLSGTITTAGAFAATFGSILASSVTSTQYGQRGQTHFTPTGASLSSIIGIESTPSIESTAFTIANFWATQGRLLTTAGFSGIVTTAVTFYAQAPSFSGGSITNYAGLTVDDTSAGGTSNRGIRLRMTSGTGKHNIYADGDADNYFAGNVSIGIVTPTGRLHLAGNMSAAAWTTGGINLKTSAATYTDTTSSGTVSTVGINAMAQPTIATSNVTTFSGASTLFIANAPAAGTNVTISSAYAIHVAAGNVRFAGGMNLNGGTVSINASSNFVVSIGTGTTTSAVSIGGASNATNISSVIGGTLGFHGATAVIQRVGAAQAAVATTGATNVTPYGFTTAAQADAIVTLVNELRAAMVEKGLIKGSA